MTASEHRARCEALRGGVTESEQAILADLEACEKERDDAIERAEFAERAKFGTPCKCQSWIDTCGKAEDRAERAEALLREARDLICNAGPLAWIANTDEDGAKVWEIKAVALLARIGEVVK